MKGTKNIIPPIVVPPQTYTLVIDRNELLVILRALGHIAPLEVEQNLVRINKMDPADAKRVSQCCYALFEGVGDLVNS